MNVNPLFFCIKCRDHLPFTQQNIIDYFLVSESKPCPTCSEQVDLFDSIQNQIEDNCMNNSIYGFIGAKTKITLIDLHESSYIELNLIEKGIPEGSKLLHLNYTPGGNLWPMDVHGNEPLRKNDSLIRGIRTFKLPHENNMKNELSCWATYIETNTDSYESIKNLVDAFVDYEAKDYKSAIIPANVAVEFPLGMIMRKVFAATTSAANLDSFFNGAATYSHQLNVLLPYICKKEGYATFNDTIRGLLNRLRSLRNDVAHSGGNTLKPSKKEMSQVLTAALFGNVYLNYLNNEIQ